MKLTVATLFRADLETQISNHSEDANMPTFPEASIEFPAIQTPDSKHPLNSSVN